ncbi:MAG: type IV secretory system conjugative DNA transfer family protein [Planctomycetaceae bacterium]|nr:type IV secretory system conjugative DNA transfer family protein [Planctomycetaceae bacterium]MCB9952135.1 type IV secretory system conjugative DNA transfer family protein [Planctomycetaceae bacterium]
MTSQPRPQRPIDLHQLSKKEFAQLVRGILVDNNLGAGIAVSGVSGSGKSNFSEWAMLEAAELGIPFLHIDPHGDAAKKTWRMCLKLPERLRKRIIYWRVADSQHAAAINPLQHPADEHQLTEYERLSRGRIQVALTASIILAAVGEGAQGFAARPVLRKWVHRWAWLLWSAGLTLADAAMLIDPHNPFYELLVSLAPDDMARLQMQALSGMKVSDLEAEIGSARNRIASLLEHPAAEVLLSRRQHTIDFHEIYASGKSLIVDLDRVDHHGEILSEDVQRLVANVVLTNYLAVVLSTPERKRQRRLCVIDELPVFSESCGPLLERMCTEIRKYRTSFLFLHQGGARFPGRTDNEFLKTIHDMCRCKIYFRHNMDAEFFGKQVALAAHAGPRVKHVQTSPQQFTVGHEIMELQDRGEGTSEMTGETLTNGSTDQLSETLTTVVERADRATQASGQGSSTSQAQAQQRTSTRTTNLTYKQTLVPKIVTQDVVTSLQFYSRDEIEWAAAAEIKELATGEAIVMLDGVGLWKAMTPLAKDSLSHAPKYAASELRKWRKRIVSRPEFAAPETIQQERKEFLQSLVQELRTISVQRKPLKRVESSLTGEKPRHDEPLMPKPPRTTDQEDDDAPWSI